MTKFSKLFNSAKNVVIGMIHVKALPGTPKSVHSVQKIIDHACEEALIYKKCDVDGILVENMHDVPYVTNRNLGPEVTAVMSTVCTEVKRTVNALPCGIQILAANNFSALAVALAAGLQFIRAEGFVFAHIADEGLIEAYAGPLLRYRKNIGAENVLILTDVKKKHCSHSITADLDVTTVAKAAEFFLSDGVILTGIETADSVQLDDLKNVRQGTSLPLLVGSGVKIENLSNYTEADGMIVGSHFKHNAHWSGNLDKEKILRFMDKVKHLKSVIS